MPYLQEAFRTLCNDARDAETWYVSLVEEVPYYGGPEEGGWWGTDTRLAAYQKFPSEWHARLAAAKVEQLARELEEQARKEYGEQCLREMDWCEQRGLNADYLPEPDGPSAYHVVVSQGLPEEVRGPRQYA